MDFSDEPQVGGTPPSDTVAEANGDGVPSSETVTPHVYEVVPEPPRPIDDENLSFGDTWSAPPQPEHHDLAPVVLEPASTVVITSPPPPAAPPASRPSGGGKPPKPPEPPAEDEHEDEGMARMSFLEHLEELRKRLLLAIGGIGVAFFLSLIFSDNLWKVVEQPAATALKNLGVIPPVLHLINPMDTFQIIWMKLPILCAVFLSSPWILYQVWAFIAPGLYRHERRWAAPFVISSAGLFILGGLFAYFVAFRYGLEFLLGLGIPQGIQPTINVNEYYDLFVDVMLGVGIIFEIPVLLFLLTLIHLASPAFLVRHSRYAILAIVILAAIITPTGDVFNLALFATPMIILFYVGIFASYILVLSREGRRFPWGTFIRWTSFVLLMLAGISVLVGLYYGYHIVLRWPFFTK